MKKIIIEEDGKRVEHTVKGLVNVYTPGGAGHVAFRGIATEEPVKSEVVWQNECCLVFSSRAGEQAGEMGLDYPDSGRSVHVCIDEYRGSELVDKLRGVPVRITIEVVQRVTSNGKLPLPENGGHLRLLQA